VDEQKRGRVLDDLKGFVKGELLFDDITRTLYSTDASIFQVRPAGVVVPRDEEDVQALVRYAGANGVPLIARGAGTGVAGEALGGGIILDMSRHFRAIGEIGSETVRVQPGVTYRELNARLAEVGRRFAPDPASGAVCTIGGMLANNASGAHALRFGYTRDHVQSLRVVLDSGDAVSVGKEPVHGRSNGQAGHLHDIVSALGYLLEENAELIRARRPRTPYNRCGYVLYDVRSDAHVDLPRLLVGSEGTLALFTEATLKTVPLPGGRALVLLGFAGMEAALQAVLCALPTRPSACELIDRRLLSLARGGDAGQAATLIPPAVEVVLLIEYEADTPGDARAAADHLTDRLWLAGHQTVHVVSAYDSARIEHLWNLRETALPSLYGLKGGAQPVPLVEDVAVPVEEMGHYLRRVQDILQEHETTASFLVHAGSGQVHTRPFLDLQKPDDVSKLLTLADKIHGLAIDLGGTVSTQHGTGLARTPWVARQYGPLYAVFRQVKAIFDPKGLFNPGKIVDPDPALARWPLRTTPVPSGLPVVSGPPAVSEPAPRWQLRWDEDEVRRESLKCNGCGHCRTEAPALRMCPIFRASPAEAATPRAKANLLRNLLEQAADGRAIAADEVRLVADLCVNCKMCAHECPARVNIPKLMLEAKAANVAEHDMNWNDWFLARTEGFARWASSFSIVTNLLIGSRSTRWLLEKLFGLSKSRRLPRFAFRNFFALARRRGWSRKPDGDRPRVAYFVDVFAAYNDPQLAEAVVAVLRHQGIAVFVPPGQRGSGAAALAQGDVDSAREIAVRNLRVLADLAREGFTIVCSEPTAAVMLRQDYRDLVTDADASLVAEHTVELTAYLADLHRQGKLKTDFRALPLAIGHHVPCHLKALGQPVAGPELLGLIPELRVHGIDVSCSGMAGTFGLSANNYEISLAAGRPMLMELSKPEVAHGATECSACRMQMENGSRKRTLHTVQYLALAYGLMPELAQRLREPFRELVL
jgi:FAD/FMN-containing dehydrogenase/Fe-S oxidoreductase